MSPPKPKHESTPVVMLDVRGQSNRLPVLAGRIKAEHDAVEAATSTATAAARKGIEHALTAGELLLEAKPLVPHGQWLPWLAENCRPSKNAPHNSICNSQQDGQPWMLKSATLRIWVCGRRCGCLPRPTTATMRAIPAAMTTKAKVTTTPSPTSRRIKSSP
jgi:hypothetical protein